MPPARQVTGAFGDGRSISSGGGHEGHGDLALSGQDDGRWKLQRVLIGSLGIEGDRVVHVEDAHGRVITSRSHPRFLGHKSTLASDGEPLVDGQRWNSSEVAAAVEEIGGRGAKLVRYDGAERFDVLPLLMATDDAIAAFGHDHRRLRPNLVVGGVEGLAERDWPGGCLRVGKIFIGVQDLRLRCVMTSYDPDT